MSERAFVRPADGLEVRHPDGWHLADEGEVVSLTAYRLAACA